MFWVEICFFLSVLMIFSIQVLMQLLDEETENPEKQSEITIFNPKFFLLPIIQ